MSTSRFVAVSASLALLLSACGDDASDAGSGAVAVSSPVSTVDAPPVISITKGATGGGGAAAEAPQDAAVDPSMSTRLAWLEFELGFDLPALDSDGAAWKLAVTDVDPATVAALAAALGIEGEVVQQPADFGGGWLVGPNDGSGPSLNVSKDGMLSWWYSAGNDAAVGYACAMPSTGGGTDAGVVGEDAVTSSDGTVDQAPVPPDVKPSPDDTVAVDPIVEPAPECVVPEPPAGVPTKEQAESMFRDFLSTLGVDPADVTIETYADEWNANVTATLMLDGMRSPLTYGVTYGGDGELLWANGFLAAPERLPDYPRIGARAGYDRLVSGNGWWGGWGLERGGVAIDSIEPAVGAVDAPTGDAATDDVAVDDTAVVNGKAGGVVAAPAPGEPLKVVITGVEEELWMIWDVDGTIWLVPGYAFTADDGGRWSVPAIPDEFLDIQEPIVPEPMPVESVPVVSVPGESVPGEETPVESPPVDAEPQFPMKGGLEALVDMTEKDATTAIELAGWTSRVVARDGEQFAVTMDYRMDRVNLTIENGVVTAATIG